MGDKVQKIRSSPGTWTCKGRPGPGRLIPARSAVSGLETTVSAYAGPGMTVLVADEIKRNSPHCRD
eukprot:3504076-Rhodomonas_salina.2